jgi:glycosyltransferase involved in cell wall biosynthesis
LEPSRGSRNVDPAAAAAEGTPKVMSRRLLQIVSSLDPSPDTATVINVSREMVTAGFDVGVISLTRPRPAGAEEGGSSPGPASPADELRQAGVTLLEMKRPARHAAEMAYQLREVLRAFRPDLVHTWSLRANGFGRLAAATARGGSLLASYRSLDRSAGWWAQVVNRRLDRRTCACIVNTQAAWDHYQRQVGSGTLRLIRDGVPQRERASEASRQEVRRRLGCAPTTKVVGVVGPLEPQRRLKDIIWAVDLLRVFHRDIRLLIIGDGPDRWRLQRYARQVQDVPRTLFLGWRADWGEWIAALDCLCQGGSQEVEPLAILEGMAAGVPVVATNTAAHRELIDPEVTGLLAALGDRGALARQLQRVLDGTPLAERLAAAAQQFVREHFRQDEMLTQYAELYRMAAHRRRA